ASRSNKPKNANPSRRGSGSPTEVQNPNATSTMTAWRGAPVSTPLLRNGNMKKIGASRATPRTAAANSAYRSKNSVTDIGLTQCQTDDFTAEIEQGFAIPAREQKQARRHRHQLESERQC